MLKEHGIALAQVDLRDGHDLALNLAGAQAKVNFRHVANARRLAPARFAYQIADVERRSTRAARKRALLVLRRTPLADDPFKRLGSNGRVGDARRFGPYRSIHRRRGLVRGRPVADQFSAVTATERFVVAIRSIAVGTVFHAIFKKLNLRLRPRV